MSSPKSHYLPTLYNLTFISLFGGLFSFLALILAPPPCTSTLSRLQALLTIPTLFFLANPLTTLLLYLTLLHPLHAHHPVSGSRRHLLRYGIAILYLFLLTAFIHLAVAAQAVNAGPPVVGYLGIALFSSITLGIVVLGLSTQGPEYETAVPGVMQEGGGVGGEDGGLQGNVGAGRGERGSSLTAAPWRGAGGGEEQGRGVREKEGEGEGLGWWRILVVLIVYVAEVALAIAIMVEGGGAALRGGVNNAVCRELSAGVVNGGQVGAEGNLVMVDVGGGDEAVSVLVSVTETELAGGQVRTTVATVMDWTSVTTVITVVT